MVSMSSPLLHTVSESIDLQNTPSVTGKVGYGVGYIGQGGYQVCICDYVFVHVCVCMCVV